MDNTYEDWCDFDNSLDISEELEEIIYGKCYSIIDSEGRFAFGPMYHYSSPEGFLGILREKNPTLWFTRYDSLNDYSERGHIFDCIRTYCDNGVKKGVLHPGFSDFVKNIKPVEECLFAYELKYTNTENGEEKTYTRHKTDPCDVYLCCFSFDADSLAMWNYYSKSNRYEGYNIGFIGLEHAYKGNLQTSYTLDFRRVIYNDREKKELLDEYLKPLNDYYPKATSRERSEIELCVRLFVETYQFLFKHSSFSHEKEVRAILKVPRKGGPYPKHFRNSNGYIVPYVELEFPKSSVTEITSAPMLQKELAERNIKELLQTYQYPDKIAVRCSSVPVRF